MDYYQGVVQEYLRANRTIFINPEFLLQLDPRPGPPKGCLYWYIDILALDLANHSVHLCEVTYSRSMQALIKKLAIFAQHWDQIKFALQRDARVPAEWDVAVMCFVPEFNTEKLGKAAVSFGLNHKVLAMEKIVPWVAKSGW